MATSTTAATTTSAAATSFEEFLRSKVAKAEQQLAFEQRCLHAAAFAGVTTREEQRLYQTLLNLQNQIDDIGKQRRTQESLFQSHLESVNGKKFPTNLSDPNYDFLKNNRDAFKRMEDLVRDKFSIPHINSFVSITRDANYTGFKLKRIPTATIDEPALLKDVVVQTWSDFYLVDANTKDGEYEFVWSLRW